MDSCVVNLTFFYEAGYSGLVCDSVGNYGRFGGTG